MKDKEYFTNLRDASNYAKKKVGKIFGRQGDIKIYSLSLYPGEIFNPAKIKREHKVDAIVVYWLKEPPNRFEMMDL